MTSLMKLDRPLLRKHMPELDVLRGCAILMVILFHGLYWSGATSSNHIVTLFIKATVVGWLGVNLFFVLSGFLITGILLDSKNSATYYRKFYLRRALRILPVYLGTIIVVYLMGVIRLSNVAVDLGFLANYLPLGYGPFWSLSVEEQFYLFWPLIVKKVSFRGLTILSVALCVVEPCLRWVSASGHHYLGDVRMATYLIADNLALGALAALFARSRYGTLRNGIYLGLALCGGGGVILMCGLPYGILHRSTVVGGTLQAVPWNLFFTGVLLLLLGLQNPFFTSIWVKPFSFLGYISYGLYLFHLAVLYSYDHFFPSTNSIVRCVVGLSVSILIAWVSRRFYEEPFLRMGRGDNRVLRS